VSLPWKPHRTSFTVRRRDYHPGQLGELCETPAVRWLRSVSIILWAALCGFAVSAVVAALAQIILDRDAAYFWPVAIALQLATFACVTFGVLSWRATHPPARRSRR
jgi:hypothetical protein